MLKATAVLGLVALVLAGAAQAAAPASNGALDSVLRQRRGERATVIVFLGAGCPVSNTYVPHLNDLAKKFESQGVKFVGVNSNSQDSAQDVEKHAREYKLGFTVVKDSSQQAADAVGAQRVPTAVVLDAKDTVRYLGRIDDRYSVGGRKDAPERADLTIALEEVLAGKEVAQPRTEVSGCLIGRDTAKSATPITYCNQVARIVQSRCQTCHRADGVAPFTLANYEQVHGWADAMKEVVTERRMPPWHADPKHGKFANDRSLPQSEIDTLVAWVDGGRTKGDERDLPKPVEFASNGWTIGQPDAVLQMAKEFEVPATGVLSYQDFVVETNFTEDRWVERAQVRPGNRRVVHHVGVFLEGNNHGEWLFLYVPGDSPLILEPGTAMKIPAGAKLRFNVHYTPNGKVERDRTEVGLIFAKQPPQREVRHRLFQKKDIKIPPDEANHREEQRFAVGHEVQMISYFPHMHLRGKSWECRAVYPDGREETILKVPGYDFNWQHTYRFAEPLTLPTGTVLHCIAHYDNSKGNRSNPDPSKTVTFGPQSWDEMLVCSLEYIVPVGASSGSTPSKTQPSAAQPAGVAERVANAQVQQFAKLAASHASKALGDSTRTQPNTDKALVLKAGEYAALVIPDERLSADALSSAGKDPAIIGQLWLKGIAPIVDGKQASHDQMHVVSVPFNKDTVQLDVCLLAIRKAADDGLELVVLGKSEELCHVPLKQAAGHKDLPLDAELRAVKDRSGVLAFTVLGNYQAELPVTR